MKLLIVDDVDPELVSILRRSGFTCNVEKLHKEKDVVQLIQGYAGLVLRGRPTIGTEVFAAADTLKFIARFGSGVEHIDCDGASKYGIEIIRAPEALAVAVAEHALGSILMVLRKLRLASMSIPMGCWERDGFRGRELTGSTVGIVGFGNTGSALAELLRGFGVRILVYDKYKKGFGIAGIEETDLETIQREADILSLHVPLTDETRKLINVEFVDRLGKQIVLVNTSRGEVVDTGSVVHGLQTNRLLGAVIDVHEVEGIALPDSLLSQKDQYGMQYAFLAGHPGVVLTPHIAGWTMESLIKTRTLLYERICQVLGIEIV